VSSLGVAAEVLPRLRRVEGKEAWDWTFGLLAIEEVRVGVPFRS
jgi:hypothetical protein